MSNGEYLENSWIAILLEVCEILHHQPLLLGSDGSAACLRHQIENPFAILNLACVRVLLVVCKRFLADEILVAESAHQRAANDGLVSEGAQMVAIYIIAWHIRPQSS